MNAVADQQRWKRAIWIALTPAVPLAAYFCLSTMLTFLAESIGLQRPAYWIFAYIGICVIWQLSRVQPKFHMVDGAFILFIAAILTSWMHTGLTGGSRTVILLSSSALIPWFVVRLLREPDIALLLRLIAIFGAFVMACYLIAIPFLGEADSWERVAFGKGVAYGVIGPTVGLLAVMTGVFLMQESLRLAWLILPGCVFVIMHMGGRGMLVSFLITLLLGCAFVPSDWKRKVKVCAVVLISIVVSTMVIPQARLEHFERLAHDMEAPQRAVDDTIRIRLRLYGQAFELFQMHPIAGVGTGRFGLHAGMNEELTTPHSTVFQVLAELGLWGTIPFLVLNAALGWIALQLLNRTLSCVVAACWIYFLLFDQISANYLSTLRYYLFAGLVVSVYSATRSKRGVFANGV